MKYTRPRLQRPRWSRHHSRSGQARPGAPKLTARSRGRYSPPRVNPMTQTNAPQQSSQATYKSALLGVDLGSNHIRVGTVNPVGQVLAFRREPYSEEARKKPRALADQIILVARQ